MITIGFYAFYEKYQATGWVKLDTIYDVVLNISLVMVIRFEYKLLLFYCMHIRRSLLNSLSFVCRLLPEW